MLRGATAANLLHGWQGPHLHERTYCLTPKHADPMERPLDYVIGYCEMLAVAGVRPLYELRSRALSALRTRGVSCISIGIVVVLR